jgi:acyl carrier protein
MSLLSGFYADAAKEREVVRNYVLNQQPESVDTQRLAVEVGELVEGRLRAKTVNAQLRTLSSMIAEEGIDRIDLLKVNVEKSELDVLLGLGAGDWPKVRQMVIEVDRHENLEPITRMLELHGFDALVEQDPLLRNTELCYVYAIRPTSAGPNLVRQQPAGAHLRSLPAVDDSVLTPATLRMYLKKRLPQYMIPSAFALVEAFPLTSNGKIDRQALLTIDRGNAQPARDLIRPHTKTEKTLAAIWAELLKVENIGIDDDFFDLGGQSLLAIKSVSRIRDAFEVDLQLRNLFERPTLAGLAETIDGLIWVAKSKAPTRGAVDREEIEF